MSFDLPQRVVKELHAARDALPGGSMKLLGTAAISMFVGLPPGVRDAVYRWAHANELNPDKMDPQQAAQILVPMLSAILKNAPPMEGAGSEAVGPPSGARKKTLAGGAFDLHYPPEQLPGYTIKTVKTYEVNKTDKPEEARKKQAKGGE